MNGGVWVWYCGLLANGIEERREGTIVNNCECKMYECLYWKSSGMPGTYNHERCNSMNCSTLVLPHCLLITPAS